MITEIKKIILQCNIKELYWYEMTWNTSVCSVCHGLFYNENINSMLIILRALQVLLSDHYYKSDNWM